MNGADIIAIIILATIVIAIIVYLLHWLYRHSSKNLSFVRTGFGGERVLKKCTLIWSITVVVLRLEGPGAAGRLQSLQ